MPTTMTPFKETLEIVPFQPTYQQEVEDLVLPIQQIEFGVKTCREDQPDLMDIAGTFQAGKGNFWVVRNGAQIVGTVGVVDIGNDQVALKKMFVRKEFRGKETGVAAGLMERAKSWCAEQGIRTIFLGSTPPMQAAHRFYEKNGFVEVTVEQLPPNFPVVPVDKKFYRCDLG